MICYLRLIYLLYDFIHVQDNLIQNVFAPSEGKFQAWRCRSTYHLISPHFKVFTGSGWITWAMTLIVVNDT